MLHLYPSPQTAPLRAMHHTPIHYGSFLSRSCHHCPPRTTLPRRGTPLPACGHDSHNDAVYGWGKVHDGDSLDPCLLDIAACGGGRACVDEVVAPSGHTRVDVEAEPCLWCPRHKSSLARPQQWSGWARGGGTRWCQIEAAEELKKAPMI
jgi:hypothetical protein